MEQLVSDILLQKADKILFLTHLALGDFTYMQNYFKAFSEKYPHLKIDLWVDEQRGKSLWLRWKKNSKKYVLYDWLETCSFFNKIYKQSGSIRQTKDFIKNAKNQNYSIIISLGTLRSHNFVRYAKLISPNGFIAGITNKTKKYNFLKNYYFNKLKSSLTWQDLNKNEHVSDSYAELFEKFFDVNVEKQKRFPFINFPQKWSCYGKLKFLKWGIYQKVKNRSKTIFINTFAKNKRRCWSVDNAIELIQNLRKYDDLYDSNFIINLLPNQKAYLKKYFSGFADQKIFLFTADVNFFQLPSIIELCDLVISVETSVIHLAAALKVPVISLMRQKNPEWIPLGSKIHIICTKNRKDWIKHISVGEVSYQTQLFLRS